MTLTEYRSAYGGLADKEVRRLIREDAGFRTATESLYEAVYHTRLNKGCTECWHDAYVLLMRSDILKLTEMQERQFELKAGALLIDVVAYDNAKTATRVNLTDELALYHLSTNPSCIGKFSKYPDNWRELAAQYASKGQEAEEATKAGAAKAPARRRASTAKKIA